MLIKTQFLSALLPSRDKAFTAKNICSGFRPTGLVPFNPDEVLSTIQRPLTPPEPPVPAVVQQLQAQTPYNLAQLEHQFARLKDCISRRSQSPPSPTHLVLHQLIKGCTIGMANTTLYAADNERLREMEERKKCKKQ
jgi:hypothetical protein